MLESGKFKLVLADADIMSKLAHWRLLHRLPESLGCSVDSIATLDSLVFRAKKAIANPDKLFRDSDTAQYAFDFLSKLPVLPNPNPDILKALQRITNIDAGEAILIAILDATDESLLATGDKRALRAINDALSKGLACNIKGRIICLEQLLRCLLQVIGHTEWLSSIANAPAMDTAVKMVCGSRCDAGKEQVLEGLSSYTESLRIECGELLMVG